MNIIPKLSLNKHPKDSENLSLVNGYHMKVSHDESCITSEESIKQNDFILSFLTSYYGGTSYTIVGIIACNTELVIIIKPTNTTVDADIFRYQEPINDNIESMILSYGGIGSANRFKYQGGKIKGVFTYNVENSLVVAITEYNVPNVKIPLRTINLGNFNNNTIHNDKDLSNSKLNMSPDVRLPSVDNLEYTTGAAYKGWYYLFIRYKINSVDYTQWYSVGTPIYVDSLEQYQIIRYAYNRDTKLSGTPISAILYPPNPDDGYGAGASDYFSNDLDIAKETFKVNLLFNDNIEYEQYQVGVICASKTYTKAFRTSDIFTTKNFTIVNNAKVQQYVLDNKSLIEYNVTDLITDTFNYYNVKNIFNYKNRLYIADYLEDNANDETILQNIVDSVNVNLVTDSIRDYGVVNDVSIVEANSSSVNQYDSYDNNSISLYTYLNISPNNKITVRNDSNIPNTITDKSANFHIMSEGGKSNFVYIEHRLQVGNTITRTYYGKLPNRLNVHISVLNNEGSEQFEAIINTYSNALNVGTKYINTDISFDKRKKQSSLIPGEVYNFFIHFTKNGHATNGYKLTNKVRWEGDDEQGVEIVPVPFTVLLNNVSTPIYASIPINNNVSIFNNTSNNKYDINLDNVKFYRMYNQDNPNAPRLTNAVFIANLDAITQGFIEYFGSYANENFTSTKWYQISYGLNDEQFQIFINNNGDRLFKIPTLKSFEQFIDGAVNQAVDYKTYNLHTIYKMVVDNVEIPANYDGFYISYEEFEAQVRATGLLTRNDFRSQDLVSSGPVSEGFFTHLLPTRNSLKSDKMFFYSGLFDISDNIKLDYNIMRIEAINPFDGLDVPNYDYLQRNGSYNFTHDMNKPQVYEYSSGIDKTYAMPDYKLVVADSAIDNRMGLGTALQIKDSYNLFNSYISAPTINYNGKINLYRVSLLNTTRDVYMSNSKKLVRLTDITYRQSNSPVTQKYSKAINNGYNGHYSYDGILIYENAGVLFNTTTNKVKRFESNNEYYKTSVESGTPHTYQNDIPFMAYLQLPICTDVFFESKSFKNKPAGIVYVIKTIGSGDNAVNLFTKGAMVTPANSIDLFENKQSSSDRFNPKTYTDYRRDLVSIESYNKTLRRSAVIQDESRSNGWRNFPLEGYKNITENKGKITNIIGIGTVLLVHTEHSLFMFDADNTLRTNDRDIQLSQPDVFEVSYKEVFTSDKGFGGLQDNESFAIDQFGYIFYSNDTNRFYQFDDGKLANIDDSILQWLLKYKPTNIRIAHDIVNNRLLIKFDYYINGTLKNTILSYNYNTKNFINQHLYDFDEAYNTKTKLYLKCNATNSIHCFIYNGTYGSYDNIKGQPIISRALDSKLSIIANNAFEIVKFLEFINYKLTKYKNDDQVDFTNSPVEEYIEPFSGDKLTVYNNMVNTGLLNISVADESNKNIFASYDKPYWDLGVWNFSYLYNKISQVPNLKADDMSRLFGNYFIIEFTFDNTNGRRIDFEELNYNLSEN